ncbi:MAG: hypothetical protein H6Q58_1918 [Firmicutes bacterium]|nr:hypothetical protein [Bacillota bacterium]
MSFLNEEGRKATVRLNTVKEDVTELEVQSAMDVILAKNIFSSKGGDLKLKDSAVIVNRENTELSVR